MEFDRDLVPSVDSLPVDPVEEGFRDAAVEAGRELQTRLAGMKPRDLVEAFKALADRSGYGPVTRRVSKSFTWNVGERLDGKRS